MNIREEYKNSVDKVEYFQTLSNDDRKKLYNSLTSREQQELLSTLPFQYLKNFITSYNLEDQQNLYKRLSDSQLKAIYRSSSKEEQQKMTQALEARQIKLNETLDMAREAIKTSTSNIEKANQRIERSNINIAINKQNIKEKKQELKQNKVILKKLTKERKKNLKRVMRAKNKTNPLRMSNKIGIISKYRTRKYLEKVENLQQIDDMIDAQKMTNEQIMMQIDKMNETIKKEQTNIEKAEKRIENEKHNIHSNIYRIERTETSIKKLSKSEKKLLGRKLYNQTVFERDCIIVRKKKQSLQGGKKQEKITNIEPQQQNIERIEPSQVEVIDSKNDTQASINNIMERADKLQKMGVNFYAPAKQINGVQKAEILKGPIVQMNQEEFIRMTYTMAAVNNYILQQIIQQQIMQQQNLSNSYQRTLSKNRGNVNFALLLSLILFIFSLVLFFIH